MGNARAAIDRVGVTTTLYENPELAAMAAICAILRDLSDDERLRVMRWAFGRFNPEFKRPLPESTPVPDPQPPASLASELADEIAAVPAPAVTSPDFERQISELNDLFPSRVAPQRRPSDPRKILEFV
jgi:hypothetical protein